MPASRYHIAHLVIAQSATRRGVPEEPGKQPWQMTKEEYHKGKLLHGTHADFETFKVGGHGVVYFSLVDASGRKTQAEHIADGPLGGRLVVGEADMASLKRFDPANDPTSREIMKSLDLTPTADYVEYPDMADIGAKAIPKGYELFRVYEPAVQGFSWAISKPEAVHILPPHEELVARAKAAGKIIPDNVLAEYPHLREN